MAVGLLFSGQGAQEVGMGQSLHEHSAAARELFAEADRQLGYDLSNLCFSGPVERLTETRYCQPALYVHGMAALAALRERQPDCTIGAALGLSLGELTALAAAGVYDFATGLRIVAERGRLMQEACDATKGGMASFIGGDEATVDVLCEEFDVDKANLNCPGQIVVSGDAERVAQAVEKGKGLGFRMVVPLQVAGAYHSRLMEPARTAFAAFLERIDFSKPAFPVFSNYTGAAVDDPEQIRENLVHQVVSSVRWEDCFRNAIGLGMECFYECGPGSVLTGLARRIDRAAKVQTLGDWEAVLAADPAKD